MPNQLRDGLSRYLSASQLEKLAAARIGIAGAGGLGSNVAMLLARCGLTHMCIVDYDFIEPSNLNRQHYWPRHIGQPKVNALAGQLMSLNPAMRLEIIHEKLNLDNLGQILSKANIWIEALDMAEAKKFFVEAALAAGCHVIAASGIAGYGGLPMRKRVFGNLVVVGDFETDIQNAPPLAPRVTQAAAMMADCALEFILGANSWPDQLLMPGGLAQG